MNPNPSWKPLAISLAAAGLLSAGLIASGQDDDYFDPSLLAGAPCGPVAGNSLKPSAWLVLAQAETQATTVVASAVADPPLYEDLGKLSYKITTKNPLTQKYFDQGLRLTYAFNHWEAARAFRMAQKLDPDCAMCYWGDALVLGPNINLPMQDDAVAPAFAAIENAKQLAGKASIKERALIEALSRRYANDPKADRAKLDAAYAEAMGKVAARYPNDLEIATLYTEALMDTQPWDYWEPGGSKPKGHADIEKTANFTDLTNTGIPANDVLEVARHVVLGRIAQAKGDSGVAIGEFELAVASEDKLSYTEPPYWYYPVRQSLGAVLLQAGRIDQAERAFRASLARTPNSGWAIYGLMQAYERRGDVKAAKGIEKQLRRAWAGEREELTLARL